MLKSIFNKIILLTIFLFIVIHTIAQQLNPLTPEEQQQVDRFIETADLFISQGNIHEASITYNKIAFIYWQKGFTADAIENFLKSVELNKKINNFQDIKAIYTNIGVIYTDIEDVEKALEFFMKSLDVRRKIGKKDDISSGLVDIAFILNILNQTEDANKYLEEALKLATEAENPNLILNCYQMLSQGYERMGNTGKSNEYFNKFTSYEAYLQEEGIKDDFTQKDIKSQTEIRITQEEKRIKELELELQEKFAKIQKDSLGKVITAAEDSLLEVERANRLKQQEIDILNKDKKLQDLAIKEQKAKQKFQTLIIYSAAGGLLFFLALAIIMFRNYRIKRKINIKLENQNVKIIQQRDNIEKKNKEIEDAFDKITSQALSISQSINYAQGIQKAMLPEQKSLKNYIPESFILFRPRDVVSGDYYWFTEVDDMSNIHNVLGHFKQQTEVIDLQQQNNKNRGEKNFAISAVDCTGHGVPGAFMSMIGYNHLDEIIGRGITRVDIILDELNKGIRHSLKQDTTDNKDGMDLAMCLINKKEKRLEYSGAKNPLVYIKNNEIFQINGDKNPIGGSQAEQVKNFTRHNIPINEPIYCYIFSDGYIDQFGGEHGRKFLIKNFRNLLLDIHKKSMDEQKEILENTLDNWTGKNYKQIDDILVIGFKLDEDMLN
ncbi:MAG: tetratricopeptide repeat protein [Bacteroidales bacterium]|nr:tetratricopeptide repeat protein [Bacteroidales bacterium]